MTRLPETLQELLDALTVERYGTYPLQRSPSKPGGKEGESWPSDSLPRIIRRRRALVDVDDHLEASA